MSIKGSDLGQIPYVGNQDAYTKNSFLIPTLDGVREMFRRMLGLERVVEYKFTDALKRGLETKEKTQYPRVFFMIQAMRRLPERQNSMAMARSGLHAPSPQGEGVKEAKLFPIELSMEFHYQDTDAMRMFQMAESLSLLGSTKTLGFRLNLDDAFETDVSLKFEDTVAVTEFELESPVDPETSEIVLGMTLNSYVGFITDKPFVHIVDQALKDAVKVSFEVRAGSED